MIMRKQILNTATFLVYKNKSFLAVIPARGGSKGLPGKNIKNLCGKPLIAWSIDSARKSEYLDEVMVTTDCNEILKIANKYGANTPFLRPGLISTDTATTYDVIQHTINFYKSSLEREFDYIVLLEPTSPLRTAQDIDASIESLLSSSTAKSIVGIGKTEDQNPEFLVSKNKNGFISGYKNKNMKVLRRQDISDVYFFEGSIYVSDVETYLERKTFYHQDTLGFEFPKFKSLEMDDMDDYIMIEAIMKHKGYCNDV